MSDRQYLNVSWHFTIFGLEETAQTGLNFAEAILPGDDALASLAEVDMAVFGLAAINAMATLMAVGGLNWAGYSRLLTVRLAAVGTDGLELADPKEYGDSTVREGATTSSTDPADTVVISTRSGVTVGDANFGRMFLPHTRMALATDSPFAAPATTATVATGARNFINTVQTALNVETSAIYEAFIITHKAGATSKEINQVQVGDVNDTQRRRRAQLQETYSIVPVP